MIFAGVVGAARTDVQEEPGVAGIVKFGDSYLMISLATGEVMVIVILVSVLLVAFCTLRCWSCYCMKRRLGAAQPAQADSDSSAASAARGKTRRTSGAAQSPPEGQAVASDASWSTAPSAASSSGDGVRSASSGGGVGLGPEARDTSSARAPVRYRESQATPAAHAESVEEALAGQAGRTAILNRYTLKVLQQKCRDLHIKIGGNKEEVVRRLTAHMLGTTSSLRRPGRRSARWA
jgi:hypothetical protein